MKFTQPPPYDVAAAFPQLAEHAKVTVRLNPRRISRMPRDSTKVGGTIIWPKTELWPTCPEHDDQFVPLLQIRRADVPELPFPRNTDIFQVLWCPHHTHNSPEHCRTAEVGPKLRIYWRNEKHSSPYRVIPKPEHPERDLLPALCRLHPERVIEYPHFWELDDSMQQAVRVWFPGAEEAYWSLLSTAPGFKVGGYVYWAGCDPRIPDCETCGNPMHHLLTIASDEYGRTNYQRWAPISEHRNADALRGKQRSKALNAMLPTEIMIGDVGSSCLFICLNCDRTLSKTIWGKA